MLAGQNEGKRVKITVKQRKNTSQTNTLKIRSTKLTASAQKERKSRKAIYIESRKISRACTTNGSARGFSLRSNHDLTLFVQGRKWQGYLPI